MQDWKSTFWEAAHFFTHLVGWVVTVLAPLFLVIWAIATVAVNTSETTRYVFLWVFIAACVFMVVWGSHVEALQSERWRKKEDAEWEAYRAERAAAGKPSRPRRAKT